MDYAAYRKRRDEQADPPRPAGTCPVCSACPSSPGRVTAHETKNKDGLWFTQIWLCRECGAEREETYRHDPDAVRVVSGVEGE